MPSDRLSSGEHFTYSTSTGADTKDSSTSPVPNKFFSGSVSLHCTTANMASGVQVDDSVIALFQDMKLKKSGKKAVFFGFSCDQKYIIVEKGKEILSDDSANFFPRLKALFPENKCCYALVDIHYITGESKKQDLIFVMWAPEEAPIKQKLLFASSKPYLTHAFPGVTKQWEVHSQDDLTIDQLAQKLTSGKIKCLEDQPL